MAATTADEVLSLEPEVLTRADDEGIESALNWLQAQPGYTTSRNRWLMRLLMARVSEQYGKNEMALHLLAELDSRAREMTLEQWKPELIFEVKARRLRLLRGKAGRSEAEKIACCQKWSHCLPGSSLWILLAPRCCAHNSRIIHIALPAPAVLCISESYYSFW